MSRAPRGSMKSPPPSNAVRRNSLRPGSSRASLVPRRAGVPDVMRGEETQLLGAGSSGRRRSLPARHAQQVGAVRGGRIARFRTRMTGETCAVLLRHSILGRHDGGGRSRSDEAFRRGVRRSGERGRVAAPPVRHARARPDGRARAATASPSYLSGLLIGHELRSRATRKLSRCSATPALAALYRQAAARSGWKRASSMRTAARRRLFRLAL